MAITINGNGTISGLSAGGISNTKAIASAALPGGTALQTLSDTKTDQYNQTTSGSTVYTNTGLEKAITLSDASNLVLIQVQLNLTVHTNGYLGMHWWLNRTTSGSDNAIAIGDQVGSNRARATGHPSRPYDDRMNDQQSIVWLDTPGSVGAHTYNIQFKDQNADGGIFFVNRAQDDSDATSRATCSSSIVLTEIKA